MLIRLSRVLPSIYILNILQQIIISSVYTPINLTVFLMCVCVRVHCYKLDDLNGQKNDYGCELCLKNIMVVNQKKNKKTKKTTSEFHNNSFFH